ncbi:MAG: hypothetical protein IJ312_05930 [Treponema sp.]|nr:hypothetical protein [Treponema sp.]
MKKTFLFVIFLFISFSIFAKSNDDLDTVIANVSDSIVSVMEKNSIIAILDFSAEKDALGAYITDQLSIDIMEIGGIRLVTRHHTDLVMKELQYQASGLVSDETALSICQQLGAQALVFGQIEEFNNNYRLQVKMIDVETGSYIIFKNYNVARSQQIERLLGHASTYYKTSIGIIGEGNMYSIKGIASAGGISFDYAFTKKINAGIKAIFSYDVASKDIPIFTIEPLAFGRFYLVSPSGEPCTGIFLEAQGGVAIVKVEDEFKIGFSAVGAIGYRFGLNRFYIEPIIRGGYPFIFGAGISAGVRF